MLKLNALEFREVDDYFSQGWEVIKVTTEWTKHLTKRIP